MRETGRREGERGKEREGERGREEEREREGEGERETDREHKHTPSTNVHSLRNALVKTAQADRMKCVLVNSPPLAPIDTPICVIMWEVWCQLSPNLSIISLVSSLFV